MPIRLFSLLLVFTFAIVTASNAQPDSVSQSHQVQPPTQSANDGYIPFVDSVALAKANRKQFMVDSIVMLYLRPDPAKQGQFKLAVSGNRLLPWNLPSLKTKQKLFRGIYRRQRDAWIIVAVLALLIYTALLNLFLGTELRSIFQALYNRNALSHTEKESGLVNSRAFVGLFILFSLCLGLLLYQLTRYYGVKYSINGFQLFLLMSVSVALLFILKFFVLKLIGFLFDIGTVVSEYISILNLTYFNIAFVLLAVVICFSLVSLRFIPLLLTITLIGITAIFAWQYLRNTLSMAANFRFHKFYLFIYLCALEICPVLILIKALDI